MHEGSDQGFSADDDADKGARGPVAPVPDIGELIKVMRRGELPAGTSVETTTEAKAHLRMVTLSVLQELQDLGVANIGQLEERLKALDPPDDPLSADLSIVASSYDQERTELLGADADLKLRQMSARALAAFGITMVQASIAISGKDAAANDFLVTSARHLVNATANLLPDREFDALTDVLHNAQMPMQRPLGEHN